jgi:hypothetical protein
VAVGAASAIRIEAAAKAPARLIVTLFMSAPALPDDHLVEITPLY